GRRRVDRGELHVSRRGGGRGSEGIADAGAGQREAGEQQCGVTVVHGGTVTVRPLAAGIRFMRGAPEKRGVTNAELGTRNAEQNDEPQRRVARSPVPRSDFRVPRSQRTNATATSPT